MTENVGCPIRQLCLGQRFTFPSLAKCTCVKPCEERCHLEGEYVVIFWDRNRDEVLMCEECLGFYYKRKCRQMLGIADVIDFEEYDTQYFDIDEHLRRLNGSKKECIRNDHNHWLVRCIRFGKFRHHYSYPSVQFVENYTLAQFDETICLLTFSEWLMGKMCVCSGVLRWSHQAKLRASDGLCFTFGTIERFTQM